MNTFLNMNWAELLNLVVSFVVPGLVLVLIGTAHIWRDRVYRERSAIRREARNDLRSTRKVGRADPRQVHLQAYLANATFSNEGNPHFGWQQRILEGSFS